MKKRLRKKKHIAEFQELGFLVQFELDPHLDSLTSQKILDTFLSEAIEANGLSAGGSVHQSEWRLFICLDADRGSVSEEQRAAVAAWMSSSPGFLAHTVGPLVDAWYSDF